VDGAGFAVDPELEQPVRKIAITALTRMMTRVVRKSFDLRLSTSANANVWRSGHPCPDLHHSNAFVLF
jgi:hypothetical protein